MRIESVLRKRERMVRRVIDAVDMARVYHPTSLELHRKILDILESEPGLPKTAIEYARGAADALRNQLYQHDLVFLFEAEDGTLINTAQMPEGWTHQRICENKLQGGRYWKGSNRPYFVDSDVKKETAEVTK